MWYDYSWYAGELNIVQYINRGSHEHNGCPGGSVLLCGHPQLRLLVGWFVLFPAELDIFKSSCLTCLGATLFLFRATLECDFLTPSPEYNDPIGGCTSLFKSGAQFDLLPRLNGRKIMGVDN